jgi:hypothetical protein
MIFEVFDIIFLLVRPKMIMKTLEHFATIDRKGGVRSTLLAGSQKTDDCKSKVDCCWRYTGEHMLVLYVTVYVFLSLLNMASPASVLEIPLNVS